MPRYDYRCIQCDNNFELRQSFSEAGSGTCPACSGEGQRVYHAVPVIYKGSGFYTTDYGRPKPPVENGGKSGSDSSKSSDDSSKSSDDSSKSSDDSKPAESASSSSDSSSGSGSTESTSATAGAAAS